jgi:prefoldin subunit 5
MSTTTDPIKNNPEPKKNNNWIYLALIGALLASNIYLFFNRSQAVKEKESAVENYVMADSSRAQIENEYNAALARLDEMTGKNAKLDSLLKTKGSELADYKEQIERVLRDKNATKSQLAEARRKIEELNGSLEGYVRQIEQLQGEKIALTKERNDLKNVNDTLNNQNTGLRKQVEVGSVLHASNIKIAPINEKNFFGKREAETGKAKKVDFLRVSFDLDANRLTEAGNQDLVISISDPNSAPLTVEALGSGTFTTSDGEQKFYTMKKSVDYQTNESTKNVVVDWKQNADYKKGNYKVEIYHRGYLIGKDVIALK